jgi:hypothetical protein
MPVNRWFWPLLWLVLLVASLGVMAWTLGGIIGGPFAPVWAATAVPTEPDLVMLLGNFPYAIEPIPVRVDIDCDPADLVRLAGWATAPVDGEAEPQARARTLHAARLPVRPADVPEWLLRNEARRVTHVKLAKQAFWHTWRGLEMAESAERERTEHRDQTLAALAESGVPLDAKVEAEAGTFQVRDLLRTSLSEFHLGQEEISWTATAYICYLPPQTTWQNRFGEQFSFDRLVEEIMQRSLTRESCGGIHLILALTKIARVDRKLSILDPGVRGRLASYLRDKVSEAVDSQSDDGSWPLCWSATGSVPARDEFSRETNDTTRVATTGHLLEWFHLLPEDLKPPARSVKAATLWMCSKLRSSSKDTVTKNFCPYTHVVVSLNLAASVPAR